MAKPLREFTWFTWWMQTQRRGGCQPSDQANRLGLWVRQKEMAATIRIHHRHLLLLSPISDTYFTVPRRVEGWVDLGTAVRVYRPCPRLYIAVAVMIKNFPQWDSNLGPLTPQSGMLPLDPLVSVHDVFNRDEAVFLLSHVYDDLLLSAAATAATPSGELSVRKKQQLLPKRH